MLCFLEPSHTQTDRFVIASICIPPAVLRKEKGVRLLLWYSRLKNLSAPSNRVSPYKNSPQQSCSIANTPHWMQKPQKHYIQGCSSLPLAFEYSQLGIHDKRPSPLGTAAGRSRPGSVVLIYVFFWCGLKPCTEESGEQFMELHSVALICRKRKKVLEVERGN